MSDRLDHTTPLTVTHTPDLDSEHGRDVANAVARGLARHFTDDPARNSLNREITNDIRGSLNMTPIHDGFQLPRITVFGGVPYNGTVINNTVLADRPGAENATRNAERRDTREQMEQVNRNTGRRYLTTAAATIAGGLLLLNPVTALPATIALTGAVAVAGAGVAYNLVDQVITRGQQRNIERNLGRFAAEEAATRAATAEAAAGELVNMRQNYEAFVRRYGVAINTMDRLVETRRVRGADGQDHDVTIRDQRPPLARFFAQFSATGTVRPEGLVPRMEETPITLLPEAPEAGVTTEQAEANRLINQARREEQQRTVAEANARIDAVNARLRAPYEAQEQARQQEVDNAYTFGEQLYAVPEARREDMATALLTSNLIDPSVIANYDVHQGIVGVLNAAFGQELIRLDDEEVTLTEALRRFNEGEINSRGLASVFTELNRRAETSPEFFNRADEFNFGRLVNDNAFNRGSAAERVARGRRIVSVADPAANYREAVRLQEETRLRREAVLAAQPATDRGVLQNLGDFIGGLFGRRRSRTDVAAMPAAPARRPAPRPAPRRA